MYHPPLELAAPVWQDYDMHIAKLFSPEFSARMATPNSVKRGQTYARTGRIILDSISDRRIEARAKGTSTYRVFLSTETGGQSWGCTCPAALGDQFCKHCVATAIVASSADAFVGDPDELAVDAYLASLSPDRLVAIIAEQSHKDERFADFLLASAQLHTGDAPNLAEWKKKVTRAYGRGFIDYRRAPAWAADVNDVLSTISDINEAGHHETAALLAEHAHQRTETASQRVDDSDGCITDIFHEIRRIHTDACLAGAFPPVKLARRLIKMELSATLDTFNRSAISHAEALGPEGLAEYGRLVDKAWAALPARATRYGKRFGIEEARIAHAIGSNDPDLLVDVMADDLITPSNYVEIVDAMERAGRIAEALEWADRGLSETPDRVFQQPPLVEARARILRSLGEYDKIEEMYWDRFEAKPNASEFSALMANTRDLEGTRARAVSHTLANLGPAHEPQIGLAGESPYNTGPVTVLLDAAEPEVAWDVAVHHGASPAEWDALAELNVDTNPADSINIWEQQVEGYIQQKKRPAYRRAVKILARIEKVASSCDRPDLYIEALLSVRSRHKNKPSLMKLLD